MNLSNVLVMCAPYGNVSMMTMLTLARFQACGAAVLTMNASADVSLTRCLQAGEAQKMLQTRMDLEWVFWLDCDMAAAPAGLDMLIRYSTALRDYLIVQGEQPGLYPSVSGCYVNRHAQPAKEIAAFALRNTEALELTITTDGSDIAGPLVPALCGLGCFLQHRTAFLLHCLSARRFDYHSADGGRITTPEVCQSRLIHASEYAQFIACDGQQDVWYYLNEDFDYCVRELNGGRLVYMAPTIFGHVSELLLLPDEQCVFRGLHKPKPVDDLVATAVDAQGMP